MGRLINAVQVINSFLLPLVGAALLFRFVTGGGPVGLGLLAGLFLAYGFYRLRFVRRHFKRGGKL